jgi:hypothetical protein
VTTVTESPDIGCLVPTYISQLPTDPSNPTGSTDLGYTIHQNAIKQVTVCATLAAGETSVPNASSTCVTR